MLKAGHTLLAQLLYYDVKKQANSEEYCLQKPHSFVHLNYLDLFGLENILHSLLLAAASIPEICTALNIPIAMHAYRKNAILVGP